MRTILFCALAALCLTAQEKPLTRESMLEDTRTLLRGIEDVHPDPYTAFGGRIAFQREAQALLRGLPAEGLTPLALSEYLSPFMARLKDGHTGWRFPKQEEGPGLPLTFKVVGEELVLVAAGSAEALGSRLVSVGGLGLAQLRARVNQLQGCENPSGELQALVERLETKIGLISLLGLKAQGSLAVILKGPDGREQKLNLAPGPLPLKRMTPATGVKHMPARGTIAWSFLDTGGHTALLAIRNCRAFRENAVYGLTNGSGGARAVVERIFREQEGRAPKDDAEILATFPSAFDTFTELAKAMKAKGTTNLVVDLRENSGGNSLIGEMLVYVLQGPDGVKRLEGGYSITRLSSMVLELRGAAWLKGLNEGRAVPLVAGDYLFDSELRFREGRQDPDQWKSGLLMFPAMEAELKEPTRAGIYKPARVIALCSAVTFSAGFDVLLSLQRTGATLIGVSPSQAANCFIDVPFLTLPHSKLKAMISSKAAFGFPDDPVKGRMLPCDLPLTYDKFKALGFDPNAEVLMALDVAQAPTEP